MIGNLQGTTVRPIGAFNVLARTAKTGQTVWLHTIDATGMAVEKTGILIELMEDGLVIDTESGTEYVPATEISKWQLPKSSIVPVEQTSKEQTIAVVKNTVIEINTNPAQPDDQETAYKSEILAQSVERNTSLPVTLSEASPKCSFQPLPEPSHLELLFAGDPAIEFPAPSFDITEIASDLRKELDRWRNRFEYAQKVREPARMAQDVSAVAELAETLDNPGLYCLAGNFAYLSGIGAGRARQYFEKAIEHNYQPAAVAIAALSIKASEWDKASEALLTAIRLPLEGDKSTLVRALGQCIFRALGAKPKGIGLLLSSGLDGSSLRLATSLVALVVKDDPEAYQAAINCNVASLRLTKIGNDLFPWGNDSIPSIMKKKELVVPSKPKFDAKSRRGSISAYYPGRNFGFIVEESTGQTWFFHKNSIESDDLFRSLNAGKVCQEIRFKGNAASVAGRDPLASNVIGLSEDAAIENEATKRAPLRVRLAIIPKDGSNYAKAKEAEQLDQLDMAEDYFLNEITQNGKHFKSAIKDLAALRSRKGMPELAIKLLDEYRAKFDKSERVSLDKMKIHFSVKAKLYHDAAKLLSYTAKNTSIKPKQIEYLRQEAYCYFAAGDFEIAISKIENLLKSSPNDNATIFLLERVKDARERKTIPESVQIIDDMFDEDEFLSSLALGLSVLARLHLENCDLRGIDERTKEKGEFEERDFKQVTELLEGVKGRRPLDRAGYHLTLAVICRRSPHLSLEHKVPQYLNWYFSAIAEAALNESAPIDVGRSYCVESLKLFCNSNHRSLDNAWTLLLGTYFAEKTDFSSLLAKDGSSRSKHIFEYYKKNADAWSSFIYDAPYYKFMAPIAFEELEKYIVNYGLPFIDAASIDNEKTRSKFIDNVFSGLIKGSFSLDHLRSAQERLSECSVQVRFQLDGKRLNDMTTIYRGCSDYLLERAFREREAKYLRLEPEIVRYLEEIEKLPTALSIEKIHPVSTSILESLRMDFARFETAKPLLELRNVLDNDFYVVNNERVALRLLLSSRDESAPPVEAIGLVLENGEGDPCHSPDPLYGGQSREIELSIIPTDKQIAENAFTVNISVEYRTRKGSVENTSTSPIAVRMGSPSSFVEIHNPYGRYSGGSPVDEDSMFFGRTPLIQRIIQCISAGNNGQCFVLYGQKRSGKSSVLKQVEKRLTCEDKSVLFVSLSALSFDLNKLWQSFARSLVLESKFRLEDYDIKVPNDWPTPDEAEQDPIEKIRIAARIVGKLGLRLIIAVDEFTKVFEGETKDVGHFMGGWKALLEAKAFNALLVGQDTMPRFKQAFPNEFGVTHDERITYLEQDEAESLASTPILLEELTRYRGQALTRLFDLTAGSPFFLQITCDRLVRHLNSRRAAFVTDADIEQVARILTVGADALPPERFDALVTAAGEKVAIVPREDLWSILARVARESLHSGWCYRNILTDIPMSIEGLKDLIDREILAAEGDRVKIRVGLFASWLRANQQ